MNRKFDARHRGVKPSRQISTEDIQDELMAAACNAERLHGGSSADNEGGSLVGGMWLPQHPSDPVVGTSEKTT